jgi:hypothetical protein
LHGATYHGRSAGEPAGTAGVDAMRSAGMCAHRMVYAALGAMMESDIHAIVARAPGEPGPS